jgi:polar amino acid transport system permease protein
MESGPYINNKNLWQQIHRSPLFDISQFILLVGAILWFFSNSTAQMGYNWQRYQIPRYIFTHDEAGYYAGPLWDGLMVTFRISGISLLLAFMIWLSP